MSEQSGKEKKEETGKHRGKETKADAEETTVVDHEDIRRDYIVSRERSHTC